MDAVTYRDRQNDRHDDHDRGKDVEHHAEREQEQVQQDQEGQPVVDVLLNENEQSFRHLGVDQVVGRCERHAEDDQDAADQHHRIAHDPRQLPQADLANNQHFDDEHVNRGHRGGFGHREIPAIDSAEHD